MLVLRLGTSSAPIDIDCSLCGTIMPAREKFAVIQTDPLHEEVVQAKGVEYETICGRCERTLKDKAEDFGIKIEFDIEVPKGTRMVVGLTKRED
jgi:hypothetical protein